jgi:hypothetical protein
MRGVGNVQIEIVCELKDTSYLVEGNGGKRKRNGAAVVNKRAARSELTARLFLRFLPPGVY